MGKKVKQLRGIEEIAYECKNYGDWCDVNARQGCEDVKAKFP